MSLQGREWLMTGLDVAKGERLWLAEAPGAPALEMSTDRQPRPDRYEPVGPWFFSIARHRYRSVYSSVIVAP